ncbi:unnamed protein product, partial [Ilex paraguariensis]
SSCYLRPRHFAGAAAFQEGSSRYSAFPLSDGYCPQWLAACGFRALRSHHAGLGVDSEKCTSVSGISDYGTGLYNCAQDNHLHPKHPINKTDHMKISVAIPCYKVTQHVIEVIEKIPDCVTTIYAVDDCCPDGSGNWILQNCKDPRVRVLFHTKNQGVGGAVSTAYGQAIKDGMDIVVK